MGEWAGPPGRRHAWSCSFEPLVCALAVATGAIVLFTSGLDVSGRLVDYSAPYARTSFGLTLAAVTLVAIALLLGGVASRESLRSPTAWLSLLFVLIVGAVIRVGVGAASPAGRLVMPLSVAGVAAGVGVAMTQVRRRPWRDIAWSAAAAVAGVLVSLLVIRSAGVAAMRAPYERIVEVRLLSVGCGAAVGAMLAARVGRQPLGGVPELFSCVVLVGATVAWWGAGGSPLGWSAVAVCVVAIHFAGWTARSGRLVPVTRAARDSAATGIGALRRFTGAAVRRAGSVVAPVGPDGTPRSSTATAADRRWALLIVALSTLTVVLDVVWAFRLGAQPIGHGATVATRAWDVGTSNNPLRGMPTGFADVARNVETHHPGPMLFYVLAPFERILGLRAGAFIGCAALSLLGWLLAVWAGFRAGGRTAALATWVAGAVVANVVIRNLTFEPVNVFPVCLALLAVPLLCWAAGTGTHATLPWAVGAASLNAQAYLPHAAVALVPVVWAALVVAADARRDRRAHAPRAALRWSAVVLAVCWAPTLWEAVTRGGGNLRALWYGATADVPSVGWRGPVLVVEWALGWPGAWNRLRTIFGASYHTYLDGLTVAGWLVLMALVGVALVRRRRATTAERRLWVVSALVLAAAGLSLARLPVSPTAFYQLTWLGVVSVFAWLAAVLIVEPLVVASMSRWSRTAVLGATARVACVGVVAVVAVLPPSIYDLRGGYESIDFALPGLSREVLDHVDATTEVLIASSDGLVQQNIADGLIAQLVSHDRSVRVAPSIGGYYGAGRVVEPGWTGLAVVVSDGVDPSQPEGRLLARSVPAGWTQRRFEQAAERVKEWAIAHGPVVVDASSVGTARSLLEGWLPTIDCSVLGDGRLDGDLLHELPAGALAKLYMDRRISSPALPASLLDEVTAVLTFTPTEVREVRVTSSRSWSEAIAPARRSGGRC